MKKLLSSHSDMDKDTSYDVRLILFGAQKYGIESVCNRILGGTEFDWEKRNAHSVIHDGEVKGKKVQLVKSPVWFRGYQLCDTSRLVKDGLVLSVTHCRPGPHAFVVLVEVDLPFTTVCFNAIKAHLSLFGEDVWSHTIVLFTCGEWLGKTSIEQYIEGEGANLAELLERCGHRYVFDSTSPPLSERLLEKVEELLQSHGGRHFQIDENKIENIHQTREEVKRRAELRRQRKEKRKEETAKGVIVSEITIVLLGWVFASKTSVHCAILGIPEKEGRTEKCIKETKTVLTNQVSVSVVDIPGWWKFFDARLVPNSVREEINKGFECTKASQHNTSSKNAFLLTLPADTSITQEQLKILRDNMKPLGDSVWDNTILVFTRGHWLRDLDNKSDIEFHIENEGEALVWLVEQCGNRYFVFDIDADESGLDAQRKQLMDMVLKMCQSAPKEEKLPKNPPFKQEDTPEEPVDEDLRKMVEVLHQVWAWGPNEIDDIAARLDKRPMSEVLDSGSLRRIINLKAHLNRVELEKILRKEMRGKSLEEVLKIMSLIYSRRICGAFDIVSMICENDQFKPEWKRLFEREWTRRETRLMEYVFNRYFKAKDEAKTRKESCDHVSEWLEHNKDDSDPFEDNGYDSDWLEEVEPSIREPITRVLKKIQEM